MSNPEKSYSTSEDQWWLDNPDVQDVGEPLSGPDVYDVSDPESWDYYDQSEYDNANNINDISGEINSSIGKINFYSEDCDFCDDYE